MDKQPQHTPPPVPQRPPAPAASQGSDTKRARQPSPPRKTLAQAFAELVEMFND